MWDVFLKFTTIALIVNPKLSKKKAQEKIEVFFRQSEIPAKETKKIKRLAMRHKIKLEKYRRRFCKKCYSDLKRGKIRISKAYKRVECFVCDEENKFKI